MRVVGACRVTDDLLYGQMSQLVLLTALSILVAAIEQPLDVRRKRHQIALAVTRALQ
jgi:hypothetical protein